MTTMTSSTATSDLHHEVRGEGPAVLLIAGATGDAGHFSRTADRLSDEFTVITYDRRGNSRSTVGADAPGTASMAAQADDAAALIEACGLDQAVVFGTSGGAIVALELVARRPDLLRGAVVHEPPLLSLLPEPEGPDPLQQVLERATRDPRGALEAFVRINSSDAAWEGLDPATRERMLGNAATLFQREIAEFISYTPDPQVLRSGKVPVVVLRSSAGLPFAVPVQSWLEQQLGVTGRTVSGHHAPYLDTPETFAEELRPVFEQLWQQPAEPELSARP
jgi:pimeloyl-ACP methyl ester carboxylesterase